jgi:hypothetical protein
MWPIRSSFLLFNVCKIFLFLLTLLPHFSHDRSKLSSRSFTSTTFQSSRSISAVGLLSEVSQVSAPYNTVLLM